MLNVRHCSCYCSSVCLMLCAYFSNAGFVDDIDANKTTANARAARAKWPIMASRSQSMLGTPGSHVSYGLRRSVNSGTMSEPRGSPAEDLTQGLAAGYYGNLHETTSESEVIDQHISSSEPTKSVFYSAQQTSEGLINSKQNRRGSMISYLRLDNKESASGSHIGDFKLLTKSPLKSAIQARSNNLDIDVSLKKVNSARSMTSVDIHRQVTNMQTSHRLRTRRDDLTNDSKIAIDSLTESVAESSTPSTVAIDFGPPEVNVTMTTKALQPTLLLGNPMTSSTPTVRHKAITSTSLKNKMSQANDLVDQAPGGSKLQQDSRSLPARPTDVSEVVSVGQNMEQNASLTNLHVCLLLIASIGAVTLLLINLAGVLCCKRLLRVKRPVSTTPIIDDLFHTAPTQRRLFLRRFSTPNTMRSDFRAASGVTFGPKHLYNDGLDITNGRGRSNSAFTSRSYSTHIL